MYMLFDTGSEFSKQCSMVMCEFLKCATQFIIPKALLYKSRCYHMIHVHAHVHVCVDYVYVFVYEFWSCMHVATS